MTDTGKNPIIRPGQRKPYVKATREQIDERIGYVARLLRDGRSKFQIHRAVKANFNVEWRQCDRYISWLTHALARWTPEACHLPAAIKQTKSCETPK